ncbi:MAG: alpha/beta fold hydrolase [Pseudomonadota bacterium]
MTGIEIPVVLLHGLGRTSASMWPLAWRLGQAGFSAESVGYPSTRQGIAQSRDAVRNLLSGRQAPCHVVGHSLGGLLAAELKRESDLDIHRVVQLGSPNLGSPVAARLGPRWPFRGLCGPALAELGPRDQEPPTNDDIAAIAGNRGPALSPDLENPHDGAVSRRSAWAGAGHRAEVPALHTLLPLSKAVAQLTIAFLQTGQFPETP